MKYRILLALSLITVVPLCHAGLATAIAKEFMEGVSRTAKNTLDTPHVGPTIARALRPALKEIKSKESVEFQVLSYIYDERDVCNLNDVGAHLKFAKSTTHKNSPIVNIASDTTYIERYKMNCEVKDINFIGHGDGIDEISKYAYAEAMTTVTVPGLIKITSKIMYIFKQDKSIWKLWDATMFDVTIDLLTTDWWLYNSVKKECNPTSNEDGAGEIQPIVLLENTENMKCATDGLNDGILVVSCKEHTTDARSYYAYSPSKNTCEQFGNKFINMTNSHK